MVIFAERVWPLFYREVILVGTWAFVVRRSRVMLDGLAAFTPYLVGHVRVLIPDNFFVPLRNWTMILERAGSVMMRLDWLVLDELASILGLSVIVVMM